MRLRLSALLFVQAGLLFGPVHESEGARFAASLTTIKVTMRAGQVQTHQHQLTLDATEENPARFKFHVEDWWRSEDGLQSFYAEPGTLRRSCGNWVSINPVDAVVEPGATLFARITISVPREVLPGGYWCVLTVDEVPDPLAAPTGVGAQFVASVSTGIFINIDPIVRTFEVSGVRVEGSEALVKLENTGDAPIGVEGRFEFRRPDESEPVAVAIIPRGTLLPEPLKTAIFRATLPDAEKLPSGAYLVRVILDAGLEYDVGVEREMELVRDKHVLEGP